MCNTKSGYICQREPDPAYKPHVIETNKNCQKGYSNYRNACYRLVKQRNSWSEAEKQCRQENGHLVSINDNFEFAFLYNFVRDVKEDLWIGLRDEDGDGIYSWTDDWPNLFLAWEKRPGQSKTPKCTYMNNSTRLWNVDNCKLYLPYVCKVTPETPPAIPIIKHKGKCPYWNDAMDFGGKYCYQIINQQTLSWGKALQLCLAQGSTLASFHSIYETELLWPLIGDDSEKLWLGLFKRFDGEFVWQDGSKVNFTNWNPSARKEGDCVYMTSIDMKWIQQSCDDGFSHPKPLCMKEKAPQDLAPSPS
ncbi:macrophage mannose receptor 1-like isoform X1 [Centruroides vittatus]|uniref:macrophage mannose receptor 1-like isoform X1 n=1 Tax=Centruroides vittatus TaxID=120091 RepID=UPI00350ECEA9